MLRRLLSLWIKKIQAFCFFRRGVVDSRLSFLAQSGSFLILTYHRVLPKKEINARIEPGMYLDPTTFEAHIREIKKKFYICTLEDLFGVAYIDSRREGKPRCCITFDDGWVDFKEYVFPILQKHNVPCTVFLPTSYIGTNRRFWTDILFDILLYSQKKTQPLIASKLSENAKAILALQGSLNRQFSDAIILLKSFPFKKMNSILNEMSTHLSVNLKTTVPSFLTWDEVRWLAKTGLVSFGSHTVNHTILTELEREVVRSELLLSRDKLCDEGVADINSISFCYPNGNYNKVISKAVQKAGYHLAVSTDFGWNDKAANRFALRRIGVHQDVSSTIPLFLSRILQS